ncbi:MAG: YeeE/YedE thiosulfate transporter family protein [Planctomycetota bacterium]|jgi:uncharacterized membrane protein YedE/YeeE
MAGSSSPASIEAARGPAMAERLRQTLVTPVWGRPWPVWAGALALCLANVLMFAYARAIGVFPQMAMWGAQLYNLLGIEVAAPFRPYPLRPPHLDLHSMIDFGIVLGVLLAAFLAREFKLRVDDWRGCLTGFVGGVLMGFGTVITPPCNVGGFYSATMALSLSGPLMACGLLLGAWVGGRYLRWRATSAAVAMDFAAAREGVPTVAKRPSRLPVAGALVFLALGGAVAAYALQGMPKHAGLLVFGAVFGVIFQRSRLCFAAAFRDILVSRNGTMMKWLLLSIGLGSLAFAVLKGRGYRPEHFVLPAGLHTVVGGFLFGIGMVIAGGCGVGILWRSAEGYVRAWCALLGGMLAAGSWVLVYGRFVGEGWLYGTPVFLPAVFGWVGGLGMVFLFLGGFYLFITWLETGKWRR